ncbi:MAG TPA: hypothetical protein VKH42_09205 [Vicinamibacterales bacterium]|nr:hypothetical protein [Vicinamibacterales bacterium]
MVKDSGGGWREFVVAALGFSALTVVFTFPLAFHLGSVGRADNGDGQFSIWNVAWVARALVVDPLHVFDANIFYPHRLTLAYSESNLGAGALAIPVYWATRNPYAAHNFVLLTSFVLSGCAMYYLVRHLTSDRRAAVVSAIAFAFCPYFRAHLPHIQLLMTAGIPLCALAFHRLVERPTPGRGGALGVAMALQAYFCGYYAVFVALMIALAALFFAAVRRVWLDKRYWTALAIAVVVAAASAAPILYAYLAHRQASGFSRSLSATDEFAARGDSYRASPTYAHRWFAPDTRDWRDPLFPGFAALAFGVAGVVVAVKSNRRLQETAGWYAGLAVLAFWASFGSAGGLYSVMYWTVPMFAFLRAPARFGLVVDFALAVLAGIGVSRFLAWQPRRGRVATLVIVGLTIAELSAPNRFPPVPPEDEGYGVLAGLPPGPVLELPVYSRQFAFARERYMLSSTFHWMPLIDAYSDYTPDDFTAGANALATFPSRDAFAVLAPMGARYAVIHVDKYDAPAREALVARLTEFAPYVRQRYAGDQLWLYEMTGFPSDAR